MAHCSFRRARPCVARVPPNRHHRADSRSGPLPSWEGPAVHHPTPVTAPCATSHIAPCTTLTRHGGARERPGPLLLCESEGGRPCPTVLAPFLAPCSAVAIAPCATRIHCAVHQLSCMSHSCLGGVRHPRQGAVHHPSHGGVRHAKPRRHVPPTPLRRAPQQAAEVLLNHAACSHHHRRSRSRCCEPLVAVWVPHARGALCHRFPLKCLAGSDFCHLASLR